MQPDSDKSNWQPPQERPSKAPYAATPEDTTIHTPVVTLTPDTPQAQSISTISPENQSPFTPNEATDEPDDEPEEGIVRWQGTEYIHHEKDTLWFVVFGIVVTLLTVVSIFIIQSITFTILIPVMAVALVVYTRRPPRVLDYSLGSQGLHVNDQLYPFGDFKAFGVIHDDLEYSIMLLPRKRFQLGVSVYFPEEAGEAIVDALAARLPMQERHLDVFDKIIHKLRI